MLKGVLGERTFVKIPNQKGPRGFRISVGCRGVYVEPIEEWLLKACPQIKDVALSSRQNGEMLENLPGPKPRRNTRKRKERHIVCIATEADGVSRAEAEEMLMECFQRLPVWQRPKRLAFVPAIPRIMDEEGNIQLDRRRLLRFNFNGGRGAFQMARRRGSRLKTPPILGAANEWQFEGFLKFHPWNSRLEVDSKKSILLTVGHIDQKTGEERSVGILALDKMATKAGKLKRGDRIVLRGHIGSFARLICDEFKVVAAGIEKLPFHNHEAMIEALV